LSNENNLKGHGFDEITAEKQREIARKGGKMSVKKRRERKQAAEDLKMLLSLPADDNSALNVQQALLVAQIKQAMTGDSKAFRNVFDTIREGPTMNGSNGGSQMQLRTDAEIKDAFKLLFGDDADDTLQKVLNNIGSDNTETVQEADYIVIGEEDEEE
jgi:hypothetical protein